MHEAGFKECAHKGAKRRTAEKTGCLKKKNAALTGEDFREGLAADAFAIKMRTVQFEGQTKDQSLAIPKRVRR